MDLLGTIFLIINIYEWKPENLQQQNNIKIEYELDMCNSLIEQ